MLLASGLLRKHMPALEKQQVISFLKILQIPTDLTPEEIKKSLLEAGWNEQDAIEAVTVLHPQKVQQKPDGGVVETSVAPGRSKEASTAPQSQIVAQKYVQNQAATKPERVDAPPPTPTAEAQTQQEEAEAVRVAQTIEQERSKRLQDVDQQVERPHTDAPWLEHQVDIYDVTPEEREEMIRTVYRTNERLSPQTIHALLGIDVDLSEFEHDYRQRKQSDTLSGSQILVIVGLSLVLAGIGFFFGMYYFEVGPFHPSLSM